MNLNLQNKNSAELIRRNNLSEVLSMSIRTGWNQTEEDWLRLLDLNPDSCYMIRKNGRILGTSTLAVYEKEIAWIGMVIVDPDFRNQGFGKLILEVAIQNALESGYSKIGLDATDLGRPLYHKYGFHDVQPIDRWTGILNESVSSELVQPMDEHHLREAFELDYRWSNCDRSQLLRRLFEESANKCFCLIRNDFMKGFLIVRPGRQYFHIGPVLAETRDDFIALMGAASVALQGKPVMVDAIRQEESSGVLNQFGLEIQRKLMRMTFESPRAVLSDPKLRASVSFEWG